MSAFVTSHCPCGRHGTVLWEDEFWCSQCALLLVGEDPALVYAKLEVGLNATWLIDAIERGERLI